MKILEQTAKFLAEKLTAVSRKITVHTEDHGNPHGVTKAQVGLGNADNTSDAEKPLSAAQMQALGTMNGTISGHVADASIHKTSSEIRAEITESDIPAAIPRIGDIDSRIVTHNNNPEAHADIREKIGKIEDGTLPVGNALYAERIGKEGASRTYDDIEISFRAVMDDHTEHTANAAIHKTSEQIRAEITGAEVLDNLLSADGSGSGLDADLLDGKHGNEYALRADLDSLQTQVGDTKDNTVTFTEAAVLENITSGETLSRMFGKIRKWFASLGGLAFKDALAISEIGNLQAVLDGKADRSSLSSYISLSQKGNGGGVAELDLSGKIPSSQLPSYVDDVLEYPSADNFPVAGEGGKIYISIADNKTWRWTGNTYVAIATDLALGETSSTAYRGDRGRIAYDYSQGTRTIAEISGLQEALDSKEFILTKNTAFNKNFGSTAGTVCEGNDPRLSNARPANGGRAAKTGRVNFESCPLNSSIGTELNTGIKIRLPVSTQSEKMICFTVRAYKFYRATDIQFSGYFYAYTKQWYEPKAIMIAGSHPIPVKMGKDADGTAYVWMGDNSYYYGLAVLDVVGAGGNNFEWNEGWEIQHSDDCPDVALSKTVYPNATTDQIPISLPANGGNADTVDNRHADEFMYIQGNTATSLDKIPTDFAAGLIKNHVPGIEYNAILQAYDFAGNYQQLLMKGHGGEERISFRSSVNNRWRDLAFAENSIQKSSSGTDVIIKLKNGENGLRIISADDAQDGPNYVNLLFGNGNGTGIISAPDDALYIRARSRNHLFDCDGNRICNKVYVSENEPVIMIDSPFQDGDIWVQP